LKKRAVFRRFRVPLSIFPPQHESLKHLTNTLLAGKECPGHQETPGSGAPLSGLDGPGTERGAECVDRPRGEPQEDTTGQCRGARRGSPTEKRRAHATHSLAPLCLDALGPTAPTVSPCPASLGYRPHPARARAPPRRLVGDPPPVAQFHASGGSGLPDRAARAALRGHWEAPEGRGATLGVPRPPGTWGVSGLRPPDAVAVAPGLHTRRRRRSRVSDAALVHDGALPEAVGAGLARARAGARADGRSACRLHAPRAARAERPPPGAPRLPRLRGRSLSSGPRCRTPSVLACPAAAETQATGAAVSWPPETGAACTTPATRVGLCAPLPCRARATHGQPLSTLSN
jgi:hypothetical protein